MSKSRSETLQNIDQHSKFTSYVQNGEIEETKQGFFTSMFGGLKSLFTKEDGSKRRKLEHDLRLMEQRGAEKLKRMEWVPDKQEFKMESNYLSPESIMQRGDDLRKKFTADLDAARVKYKLDEEFVTEQTEKLDRFQDTLHRVVTEKIGNYMYYQAMTGQEAVMPQVPDVFKNDIKDRFSDLFIQEFLDFNLAQYEQIKSFFLARNKLNIYEENETGQLNKDRITEKFIDSLKLRQGSLGGSLNDAELWKHIDDTMYRKIEPLMIKELEELRTDIVPILESQQKHIQVNASKIFDKFRDMALYGNEDVCKKKIALLSQSERISYQFINGWDAMGFEDCIIGGATQSAGNIKDIDEFNKNITFFNILEKSYEEAFVNNEMDMLDGDDEDRDTANLEIGGGSFGENQKKMYIGKLVHSLSKGVMPQESQDVVWQLINMYPELMQREKLVNGWYNELRDVMIDAERHHEFKDTPLVRAKVAASDYMGKRANNLLQESYRMMLEGVAKHGQVRPEAMFRSIEKNELLEHLDPSILDEVEKRKIVNKSYEITGDIDVLAYMHGSLVREDKILRIDDYISLFFDHVKNSSGKDNKEESLVEVMQAYNAISALFQNASGHEDQIGWNTAWNGRVEVEINKAGENKDPMQLGGVIKSIAVAEDGLKAMGTNALVNIMMGNQERYNSIFPQVRELIEHKSDAGNIKEIYQLTLEDCMKDSFENRGYALNKLCEMYKVFSLSYDKDKLKKYVNGYVTNTEVLGSDGAEQLIQVAKDVFGQKVADLVSEEAKINLQKEASSDYEVFKKFEDQYIDISNVGSHGLSPEVLLYLREDKKSMESLIQKISSEEWRTTTYNNYLDMIVSELDKAEADIHNEIEFLNDNFSEMNVKDDIMDYMIKNYKVREKVWGIIAEEQGPLSDEKYAMLKESLVTLFSTEKKSKFDVKSFSNALASIVHDEETKERLVSDVVEETSVEKYVVDGLLSGHDMLEKKIYFEPLTEQLVAAHNTEEEAQRIFGKEVKEKQNTLPFDLQYVKEEYQKYLGEQLENYKPTELKNVLDNIKKIKKSSMLELQELYNKTMDEMAVRFHNLEKADEYNEALYNMDAAAKKRLVKEIMRNYQFTGNTHENLIGKMRLVYDKVVDDIDKEEITNEDVKKHPLKNMLLQTYEKFLFDGVLKDEEELTNGYTKEQFKKKLGKTSYSSHIIPNIKQDRKVKFADQARCLVDKFDQEAIVNIVGEDDQYLQNLHTVTSMLMGSTIYPTENKKFITWKEKFDENKDQKYLEKMMKAASSREDYVYGLSTLRNHGAYELFEKYLEKGVKQFGNDYLTDVAYQAVELVSDSLSNGQINGNEEFGKEVGKYLAELGKNVDQFNTRKGKKYIDREYLRKGVMENSAAHAAVKAYSLLAHQNFREYTDRSVGNALKKLVNKHQTVYHLRNESALDTYVNYLANERVIAQDVGYQLLKQEQPEVSTDSGEYDEILNSSKGAQEESQGEAQE